MAGEEARQVGRQKAPPAPTHPWALRVQRCFAPGVWGALGHSRIVGRAGLVLVARAGFHSRMGIWCLRAWRSDVCVHSFEKTRQQDSAPRRPAPGRGEGGGGWASSPRKRGVTGLAGSRGPAAVGRWVLWGGRVDGTDEPTPHRNVQVTCPPPLPSGLTQPCLPPRGTGPVTSRWPCDQKEGCAGWRRALGWRGKPWDRGLWTRTP